MADSNVEKFARDTPVTPLPVVLKSARKTSSVRGSPVFQIDHRVVLMGVFTTVFLNITLLHVNSGACTQ